MGENSGKSDTNRSPALTAGASQNDLVLLGAGCFGGNDTWNVVETIGNEEVRPLV